MTCTEEETVFSTIFSTLYTTVITPTPVLIAPTTTLTSISTLSCASDTAGAALWALPVSQVTAKHGSSAAARIGRSSATSKIATQPSVASRTSSMNDSISSYSAIFVVNSTQDLQGSSDWKVSPSDRRAGYHLVASNVGHGATSPIPTTVSATTGAERSSKPKSFPTKVASASAKAGYSPQSRFPVKRQGKRSGPSQPSQHEHDPSKEECTETYVTATVTRTGGISTSYSMITIVSSTVSTIELPAKTMTFACQPTGQITGGALLAASTTPSSMIASAETPVTSPDTPVNAKSSQVLAPAQTQVKVVTPATTPSTGTGSITQSNDEESNLIMTSSDGLPPPQPSISPGSSQQPSGSSWASTQAATPSFVTKASVLSPLGAMQPNITGTDTVGSVASQQTYANPASESKPEGSLISGAVIGGSLGAILCAAFLLFAFRKYGARTRLDPFVELPSTGRMPTQDRNGQDPYNAEKGVLASRFSLGSNRHSSIEPKSAQSSRTSRLLSLYASFRQTLHVPPPATPRRDLIDPGFAATYGPSKHSHEEISPDRIDFSQTPVEEVSKDSFMPCSDSWYVEPNRDISSIEYLQPDRLQLPTPGFAKTGANRRVSSQYSQDSALPDRQSIASDLCGLEDRRRLTEHRPFVAERVVTAAQAL